MVPIQEVLMGCELSIEEDDEYTLNSDDKTAIKSIIHDRNTTKQRKPRKLSGETSATKNTSSREVQLMVDGRVMVEVEGTSSKTGRLQRKRRVVLGDV